MIKYFCDRCGEEMSEYKYLNDSYSITVFAEVNTINEEQYKLCGSCYRDFKKFIKGDKSNG